MSATERFMITSIPSDFLDLKTGKPTLFRAGLNHCAIGLIPANGLLYTTHPIGAYDGRGLIDGHAAMAPKEKSIPTLWSADDPRRLEKNPADSKAILKSEPCVVKTSDGRLETRNAEWVTYRHDARRSAGTRETLPANLKLLWSSDVKNLNGAGSMVVDSWLDNTLGGDKFTAPVVAGGRVYVGVVDAHQIVALDAKSGKREWHFTAGGRIDVPPTIHKGLCLFGSADGCVYCLRASDGKLIWRFQAAPFDRRVSAFGQLESEWPVVGGVMVENELAYFVAGRSTQLDGGLTVYALEPASGKLIWTSQPQRPTGKNDFGGLQSDLLVSDGKCLSIGGSIEGQFDLKTGKSLRERPLEQMLMTYPYRRDGRKSGLNAGSRHLNHVNNYTPSTGWQRNRGCRQYFCGVYAHLLAFNPADKTRVFASQFQPYWPNRISKKAVHCSQNGLFAIQPDPEMKIPAGRGENTFVEASPLWVVANPANRRFTALALAGDTLIAAGAMNYFERKKGEIWVLSTKDGKKQQVITIDDAPAAEGLAVAYGRLFVSTRHGSLMCFGKK